MSPEIIKSAQKKAKVVAQKKCACGCVASYRANEVWTEHGNTESRCPECQSVIFLGRFGLPDTY